MQMRHVSMSLQSRIEFVQPNASKSGQALPKPSLSSGTSSAVPQSLSRPPHAASIVVCNLSCALSIAARVFASARQSIWGSLPASFAFWHFATASMRAVKYAAELLAMARWHFTRAASASDAGPRMVIVNEPLSVSPSAGFRNAHVSTKSLPPVPVNGNAY